MKKPELKNIMYDEEKTRIDDLIMGCAVIRALLTDSGVSMRGVSRMMGRNDNYMAITLSKSKRPGLEIVAEVADTLGYDLQIVKRDSGEVIGRVGYLDPELKRKKTKAEE